MKKFLLISLLLALHAAPATAQEGRRPARLPDGVAAIVRGEVITMDEYRRMLVQRYSGADEGKKALEELVEKQLVEMERQRQGVTVTEQEVSVYVKKIESDVRKRSAHTQTLDDVLAEQKLSRADFYRVSRDFLIRQKLAARALGAEGELSLAQLGIWMESLKRKRGVLVGGPGLPAGVHARVAGRNVTDREFGQALIENLPKVKLNGALWDLAIARAVNQDLRAKGIQITEADVEAAVADLERKFRQDPRFKSTTLTFEQYVQAARHRTVAELKKDPHFRAQVGLVKSIRASLSSADVREYYEANAGRYGERRKFVHLLVKADDRPSFGQQARTYPQAKEIIDALYLRYLRGTAFEKLIIESSEDRSATARPDRIISASRSTPLPQALKKTLFTAPLGEVVGPVRSAYGYHLLKLMEVLPAPTYEEVRGEVLESLVRERRDRARLEILQDESILLRY